MSASRKFLKIVSIITILSGITYVVAALVALGAGMFGGMDTVALEDLPIAMPAEVAGILLAIIAGANAIFNLVLGFLGMRAANVPSKVGPVYVFTIVCLVVSVINLVFVFLEGFGTDIGHTFSTIFGLIVNIVMFLVANNVKKEYEAKH